MSSRSHQMALYLLLGLTVPHVTVRGQTICECLASVWWGGGVLASFMNYSRDSEILQETKTFTMLGEIGMANRQKPHKQVCRWLNTMNKQGIPQALPSMCVTFRI